MKEKIRIILNGIIIPVIIYLGISAIIIMGYRMYNKNPSLSDNFIAQAIANITLVLILAPTYYIFQKKYKTNEFHFGFGKAFYLIPLAISLCVICNVIIGMFTDISKNSVTEMVNEFTSSHGVMLTLILVSFIVPIVEEILFRGFFFDAICITSNYIIAIIISSILFALAHGNMAQGIYAFVAGIILSYIRYSYKSVVYSVIMHLLMNLSSIFFVSTIIEITDIRTKVFQIFIMMVIFMLSLYRIIAINNKK